MKITYETTVDEVTDVIVRRHQVSGLIRTRKWQALALFILYFIVYWFLVVQKNPTTVNTVSAILTGITGFLVFLLIVKPLVRLSVRRFVVKKNGGKQPVPAEIELLEHGAVFRKLGRDLSFNWDNVAAVNETDQDIELITEPPYIGIIYKRIFTDPQQLNAALEFIENHIKPGVQLQRATADSG